MRDDPVKSGQQRWQQADRVLPGRVQAAAAIETTWQAAIDFSALGVD